MKTILMFSMTALLVCGAAVQAKGNQQQHFVVTASNTTNNQLLVYDTKDNLIQTISTQGQGGVSGNSGGVVAHGNLVAAVNFGSKSVSLFERGGNSFEMKQLIPVVSSPVSIAFGHDHLYVLGTAKVESHPMFGSHANPNPDGVVTLIKGDGSSAQVGVLGNQLIVTEKSNVIETVNLRDDGAASGAATLVQNIPANVNAPYGLITRGNNAYVTIAHADEISLVRNDKVLTTTPSGTQHAPCWLALVGPFLFSTNTSSMTVSRYAVYGQKIVQDAAIAAQLNGNPTDIAARAGLVAVVDGNGPLSHLTIFSVDEDGNISQQAVATISSAANGVAIVTSKSENDE